MHPLLGTFRLENASPAWFWLALLVVVLALTALTYRRLAAVHEGRLGHVLLALRTVSVLLLLLSLVKPAWTRSRTIEQRPQLAVLIDDSQSMSLLLLADDDTEPMTRYDKVMSWWSSTPTARKLRRRFDVQLFNVEGVPVDAPAPQPVVAHTDLPGAVHSAETRLRGRHLAGILLLSDGRDTSGHRPAPHAVEKAVFALGLGAGDRRDDDEDRLWIESVTGPPQAHVGHEVTVQVHLRRRAPAAAGGEVAVLRLERAHRLVASQKLTLNKAVVARAVPLSFTPTEAGDFIFTARVRSRIARSMPDSTGSSLRLRVHAEPISVLYVEGVMRHEHTFLRQRLTQDADLSLAAFVRGENPTRAAGSGVIMDSRLIADEALKSFKVVLLGDFEAGMLDDRAYLALKRWVEAGGGLMVLGGYLNLAPAGLTATPLAEVLPVETATAPPFQLEAPFHPVLTERGRRHPIFRITADALRDAEAWGSLAKLDGVALVGQARQGATVLARHPQQAADGGEGAIVLATHRYGKGRVAVLTADTTWRWSRLERMAGRPDVLYARFWSQAVRWLAGLDRQADRAPLSITLDKPFHDPGRPVLLRVQVDPATLTSPDGTGRISVSVRTPQGKVDTVEAAPDAEPSGHWTARYVPRSAGRFEAAAQWTPSAQDSERPNHAKASATVSEFLVRGSKLELADASADPAALRWLAAQTAGQYADLADEEAVERLVDAIPRAPRLTVRSSTVQVWNNPVIFLLFIAVLSAEWLMRRRHRMA
jgi:uncharacterized membrane protein